MGKLRSQISLFSRGFSLDIRSQVLGLYDGGSTSLEKRRFQRLDLFIKVLSLLCPNQRFEGKVLPDDAPGRFQLPDHSKKHTAAARG